MIEDKNQWSYRLSTQQKQTKKALYDKVLNKKSLFVTVADKVLFTLQYQMAKFSKVAATFGKNKCNDQKMTTSCPDSKHLLFTKANM